MPEGSVVGRLVFFRPKARKLFGGAGAGSGSGSGSGVVISKTEVKESSKRTFIDVLQSITFFLLVTALSFAIISSLLFAAFKMGQHYNPRDYQAFNTPRILPSASVKIADDVFDDWATEIKQTQVIARKSSSVALSDSVVGDPSDHMFLGVYERDRTNRKLEAGLHFYIAAANGHPDAFRYYKALNIPTEDYEEIYQLFIAIHELNGDFGLMRLGQHHLGKDAFKIADRMRTRLRYAKPNDYVWPREKESPDLAYINFQMASLCGLSSAYEWRAETARFYKFTIERENTLKQRANRRLAELAERFGGDQDAYCKRYHLKDAIEVVRDFHAARALVRYEAELAGWDGSSNPCDLGIGEFSDEECDEFEEVIRNGYLGYAANLPTIRELIDAIIYAYRDSRDFRARYRGRMPPLGYRNLRESGSQVYRDNPGGQSDARIAPLARDGLPDECVQESSVGECITRESALACNDRALYHFRRGEADMAVGRVTRARQKFNRALAVGRACQSEYSVLAGRRLAALNLTCEYSADSLARISRDYLSRYDGPNATNDGDLIALTARQRALAAKGYYEGRIDGRYGRGTRAAVQRFQREFGFSETGDLTPIETVYLICSAAETHAHRPSMNLLGIMYVSGLGVVQNTDAGLRYLRQAADNGSPDAMFNLALIYGTGAVFRSYQVCGIVENFDRADGYLQEASDLGHPVARALVVAARSWTGADRQPEGRWAKITRVMNGQDKIPGFPVDDKSVKFYQTQLSTENGMVGGCRPNGQP